MKFDMRIYKRGKWWWVQISRSDRRPLKTQDEREAKALVRAMEKAQIEGKLTDLSGVKRISLKDFSEAYIADREGHASPETIKKDNLSFRLLSEVIPSSTPVQAANIKKFVATWRTTHPKTTPTTINGYLRHLKAAFKWGVSEGIIDKTPKIKMLKESDRLPRVLLPAQINTIFAACPDDDLRFFTFLLWTGCRRSEALNLTWDKVNLERQTARVTGKGSKERIVPLHENIIHQLNQSRRDIGRVFKQYYRDTWSKRFHNAASACGINARLHDLRHSAATYMLASGIDIREVQAILGHSQISTTMIYADVLEAMKVRAIHKMKIE
jgi:integrase/recombinase XerD